MANLSDLLGGAVSELSDLSDCTKSSSDPAVDTNPSATGHLWVNTTSGEVYVCTDATAGANVWTNVGDGADAVEPPLWWGGRGITMGGSASSGNISYFTIATTGNATSFGSLSAAFGRGTAFAGGGRAIAAAGDNGHNDMEYITIATTGNATFFGDMTVNTDNVPAGMSNGSRGLIAGGRVSATDTNNIDYITIASTGNATDFGNLVTASRALGGASDGTYGLICGGQTGGSVKQSGVQRVTIASTGNASSYGSLIAARDYPAATGGGGRLIVAGGGDTNQIQYRSFSSSGSFTDFGNLTAIFHVCTGTSNDVRAVFTGNGTNVMNYVTIASTGNATDFGDLLYAQEKMGMTSGD